MIIFKVNLFFHKENDKKHEGLIVFNQSILKKIKKSLTNKKHINQYKLSILTHLVVDIAIYFGRFRYKFASIFA